VKRLAATVCSFSLLLAAAVMAQQLEGAFTLRGSEKDDRLNLNFQYEDGRSNYGRMIERAAISDVSRSGERITFALKRAAGTFTFEGRGTLDRASGWYGFSPSQNFAAELDKLGYRGVEPKHLFVFALDDLSIDRLRRLERLVSNKLDTDELVRLINHGAGYRYIQSMSDLGFRSLRSDEYRRARDHGVSENFVREMRDLAIKLPLDELIRLRDHGVNPEFVRALRSAGFSVSHDELVRARDHGVTAEFLKRMREHGFDKLSLAEYVRMRDHGVTPDYVQALKEAGYGNLTAEELVRLRDHGVTASYVRRVKELLKDPPSVEQLIRMRSRGDFGSR
jgi:hypothetical protein